jgi:hypothetical protein
MSLLEVLIAAKNSHSLVKANYIFIVHIDLFFIIVYLSQSSRLAGLSYQFFTNATRHHPE